MFSLHPVFFLSIAALCPSRLSAVVMCFDNGFRQCNYIPFATHHAPNRFFQHGIELATACADLAGLIERTGGIESIIRGAAYSRAQAMDASFVAEVSAFSPLFNLPVVAIQRGRDHGKQWGRALHQCRSSKKGEKREDMLAQPGMACVGAYIAPNIVFTCCAVSSQGDKLYGLLSVDASRAIRRLQLRQTAFFCRSQVVTLFGLLLSRSAVPLPNDLADFVEPYVAPFGPKRSRRRAEGGTGADAGSDDHQLPDPSAGGGYGG